MKKYLALVSALVFVLGFSAVAFAIHAEIPSETQAVVAKGSTQITLGGEIRARGELRRTDFNSDAHDDIDMSGKVGDTRAEDGSYYDARVRLSVDAQVTPNTQGFVQVEAGDGDTKDNYNWGVGNNGAKGIYGYGNAKRGQFNVLQAWILHKGEGLLGIPAGVKVGHMPLALGNKLFFDHTKFGDDAIVFFIDPTKELHIGLLTAKFREGNVAFADDADAYVGLFTYKLANGGISGDVTYVDDRNFQLPTGFDTVHFWNIGLRGDMAIDTITVRADLELQTGSIDNANVDFAGYAFLVGADIKLDPVKLTAEFAYGSGPTNDPDKVKSFVTSLGADPHFTYVYEYSTPNACSDPVNNIYYLSGGICNTMYVKLGASAEPVKDLTASLNLFWLKAVEDETFTYKEDDIGIEIDPKITYKIDRNLTYWVEGGYLIAGDFWKNYTGGKDPDNAYAIRHGIQLSF